MIIKKMKIGEIQVAEYNPRIDLQPGDPEYEKIKKSIDEFDLVEPLIVNKRNNKLVGGHQRLKVLQVRGDTEVQVSIVDLDEPHEKALNLALNKTGGDWVKNKLSALLTELSELSDMDNLPNFDVDLTGFDIGEIENINHEQEVHNARYKPGEGSITGDIQFIEDEIAAMTPDEECQAMFEDKKIIYISYSGGKDSSFALYWAKINYPDKHIIAVFSDTGVEFPGFTAHIHKSCTFLEVEYKIVKPRVDIWINMLKYGWPSIIHRQCQPTLIYEPINRIYKEHEPEDIMILDGSRADQVTRTTRKTKTSNPSDPTMKKYTYYHPAFDINKELLEQILKKSGMPIWEGYDMGFVRTACWMCPGQNSAQAYALSLHYPGLVDVIRRWEIILDQPIQSSNKKTFDDLINTGIKKHKRKQEKDKSDEFV